jgi:hypothetical protein
MYDRPMGAWQRFVKRMEAKEAKPADPSLLNPTRGRSDRLVEPAWDESKPLGTPREDEGDAAERLRNIRRRRDRARQRWLGIGR